MPTLVRQISQKSGSGMIRGASSVEIRRSKVGKLCQLLKLSSFPAAKVSASTTLVGPESLGQVLQLWFTVWTKPSNTFISLVRLLTYYEDHDYICVSQRAFAWNHSKIHLSKTVARESQYICLRRVHHFHYMHRRTRFYSTIGLFCFLRKTTYNAYLRSPCALPNFIVVVRALSSCFHLYRHCLL